MNNCIDILANTAKTFGSHEALVAGERKLTFNELLDNTNKLSNSLIALGVNKGDKVAVFLPNSIEFFLSYLSLFSIGAIIVPLDARLAQEELAFTLNHCEAKFLISYPPRAFSLGALFSSAKALKNIITLGPGQSDKFISFQSLIEKGSSKHISIESKPDEMSAIFYTSGTTSTPKGVMWNHRHLESGYNTITHFLPLDNNDAGLCTIPLSHSAGVCWIMLCIKKAMKIVFTDRFVPTEILHIIQNQKISLLPMVPTIFVALLNTKEFRTLNLQSLKWVVNFGAPISADILKDFGTVCPNAKLLNGYGLTETPPPVIFTPPQNPKLGSVGKPAPGLEVKIFDESDKEVVTGAEGEIALRGAMIMTGYYKELGQTSQAMRNGWFHTGDLGSVDADGYVYILGRIKEMIKTGGLIVFPAEVEGILLKHPDIAEAAVVGVVDRLRGESVKAAIVAKRDIDKTEIIEFCKKHLANFKVPHIVEFRQELPKTASGKVQKELLK